MLTHQTNCQVSGRVVTTDLHVYGSDTVILLSLTEKAIDTQVTVGFFFSPIFKVF